MSKNPMAKKRRFAMSAVRYNQMFEVCCSGDADSGFAGSPLKSRFTMRHWPCNDGRMPKRLTRAFFSRSVHEVAPDLIGATLLFNGAGGRIVEVEAYHHTDPAAHSYRGPTDAQCGDVRPARLRLCLPFLRHSLVPEFRLRAQGLGQRRAPARDRAERRPRDHAPTAGSDRRTVALRRPGRLCEALNITGAHNGLSLDAAPFELFARQGTAEVVAGPRIGIAKAIDRPWRYGLKGSRFLSKPFAPAG